MMNVPFEPFVSESSRTVIKPGIQFEATVSVSADESSGEIPVFQVSGKIVNQMQ